MTQTKLISALASLSLFVLLLPCVPPPVHAAPGDLDPTFGSGGKVSTDFGGRDLASAMVLQPDGKLVVAGSSSLASGFSNHLARYNPDGGLDASFGSGGKVTSSAGVFALALQPDGKIVAAGSIAQGDFALARYLPDGSLDSTFGVGGTVVTGFAGLDLAFALALQPDGKIVAAGRSDSLFALVRYNSDGSLDVSFGSGGKVTTDFGSASDRDAIARAVALQADGKIVVAGELVLHGPSTRGDFALARYNPDGSLDASFGGGGMVTTDFANNSVDAAFALALQPDGKIVAAGAMLGVPVDFPPAFALARYHPDGGLDVTFGAGGKVTSSFGGPLCFSTICQADAIRSLAFQPDGKLIAGGRVFTGFIVCCDPTANFAIARYHPDGSLDLTFGVGGMATTDFGGDDVGNALVLQPDGKIVLAGGPHNTLLTGDFLLARYRGDPTLFVGLTLNDSTPMPGELLEIGTREANSGPDTLVDRYLGSLLPPGTVNCPANDPVAFVTETLGLFLACLSASPDTFPPFGTNVLIPADLPLTITENIFSVLWPAGAPGGIYTLFMAYIASGSVADGVLDPGDLLAVGAATVTAMP